MTVSDRLRPSASTYEAWNLLFGLVALYSPSLLLPPLTPAFFIIPSHVLYHLSASKILGAPTS